MPSIHGIAAAHSIRDCGKRSFNNNNISLGASFATLVAEALETEKWRRQAWPMHSANICSLY